MGEAHRSVSQQGGAAAHVASAALRDYIYPFFYNQYKYKSKTKFKKMENQVMFGVKSEFLFRTDNS